MNLIVQSERFPIAGRFSIARGSKTEAAVVTVTISEGSANGRGECVPYSRYGETPENVVAAIEKIRRKIEHGLTRHELQALVKPGAARNAIDCALWDLEAKKSGHSVAQILGLEKLSTVMTAFTISLDTPEVMAENTAKAASRKLLKIKLGGAGGDIERIRAVRQAAPHAQLIADANEGWTTENLSEHFNALSDAGFSLIEQPLPVAFDEHLRTVAHPVPLCADESVHDRAGLSRLVGLYEVINIKLDKTGGLTEALALADEAERLGFKLMMGCMVGTSLAMAPALVVAARAQYVDLDGPLLLAQDREHPLRYEGSTLYPPTTSLWG